LGRIARAVATDAALLITGFVLAWLLLMVLFPMQPVLIFKNSMAAHRLATLGTRTYAKWAVINILLFAIFCGWPLALLLVARIRDVIKLRQPSPDKTDAVTVPRTVHPAVAIGGATILTMLLLTFSGSVRGETERLWFFLLPPLCAFAATAWPGTQGIPSRTSVITWTMLLLLQVGQTLFMAALLSPLVRPLV
jgi:hypothetical protein